MVRYVIDNNNTVGFSAIHQMINPPLRVVGIHFTSVVLVLPSTKYVHGDGYKAYLTACVGDDQSLTFSRRFIEPGSQSRQEGFSWRLYRGVSPYVFDGKAALTKYS